MNYRTRIKQLEKHKRINEGYIHMVFKDGDSYRLEANGGDVTDDVVMTYEEYKAWSKTLSSNDCVFLITYRDEN